MRLSALDIKKKEFQQKMRGIDQEEVQGFLDQVSVEVELLASEKKEYEERLMSAMERLEHFVSLEQTIEKTLAAAQQTAVKMEDQARREADLILRDAELDRSRKVTDARMEVDRVQSELLRARGEYQSMLSRMRALMAGFTTFIQSLEQDAAPVSTNSPEVTRFMEFHE